MYFPFLNASRAEIDGLLDVLAEVKANRNIRPVFIPTKSFGIKRLVKDIFPSNLRCYVVTNPHHGMKNGLSSAETKAVFAFPDVIPTLRVTRATTLQQVRTFTNNSSRSAFLLHEAITPAIEAEIAQSSPRMVFCRERHGGNLTSARAISALGRAKNCTVFDHFKRQNSSASYPKRSIFGDRHYTITTDPDFKHFGDFTVIGDVFKEGGSPPYAIAVHYIYSDGPHPASKLYVAHYVSQTNQSVKGDATGKIREACEMLVADNPRLQRKDAINTDATLVDFTFYAQRANKTNPERMKRLAIKHHLLLMTNLV